MKQESIEKLKAEKEEISKMAVNLERDNQGMAKRIAELEAQIAGKEKLLYGIEQLPKEPVYNADWLNKVIQKHVKCYGYPYSDGIVYILIDGKYFSLDPKTSADIILRALAKELNGTAKGLEIIVCYNGEYGIDETLSEHFLGAPLFVDAQKAIDILNQIDPQILKNYFA